MLPTRNATLNTVADLYQYLDSLFDQEVNSDTLFASGYLRGFISISATEFGDEQQIISPSLVAAVADNLRKGKTELNPQDQQVVQNFWSSLNKLFVL